MPKQHEKYRTYRALLHLYPKQHRQMYGEQMVQTLEDMLSEQHTSFERFAVWLKVSIELPINIVEENISGLGDISVNKLTKITAKQYVFAAVVLLLAVGFIAQRNQNGVLGSRIDNAEQNQRAMNGGGYYPPSIVPGDNAVYLPLAKLKLADTKLNEQLVYSYQESRPSPDGQKTYPAEIDISTHDLSVSNFSSSQLDCSQVVYADFATPSYPINPMWKFDGSAKLADGRTMNVYYAPSIEGCEHSWDMNKIDSKAIAESLKEAVSY